MVIVMIFAVGLNAMAARMTHPGAFYTYVTAGLGRAFGLAAGLVAMISYLAIGAGTYALFAVMGQGVARNDVRHHRRPALVGGGRSQDGRCAPH